MSEFDKFYAVKEVLKKAYEQAERDAEIGNERGFIAYDLMQQIEYAVELLDADSRADEVDV